VFDYKRALKVVRQYTGDAFSASNGYALNRKPNFGQRMAVLKYYEKIAEMTATPYQVYTPKKREKREAFSFTGQAGFRKFKKAIIRKTDDAQRFTFTLDKSRPRGSRFVAIDAQTGRRYYNIPAALFMDASLDEDLVDENEAIFRQIIDEHAGDAKFFLIQAGDAYMWGAGGSERLIAKKLAEVFRNYSPNHFDPYDKNSSYYGNWFRGLTGFTSQYDALPKIAEAQERRRDYRARMHIGPRKYRRLLGYDDQGNRLLGEFENGELINIKPMTWEREEDPRDEREKARAAGYLARKRGHARSSVPFAPGTMERRHWFRGYDAAKAAGW
jgi:hypothetical protein